ncbi:hypothetical protein [Mycoplasmopsis pullorum]|uniref:hypothetical protein n=1 Tax=Mycoplasmopsis pullorum TaxID=48003 RepID=UPI00111BC975|nr:hypothetical protein [Mycoplasmopsis pullorum]TNK85649.1 hypothetical protein C4M92_00735 [Mycoplasmopsis pullorum]
MKKNKKLSYTLLLSSGMVLTLSASLSAQGCAVGNEKVDASNAFEITDLQTFKGLLQETVDNKSNVVALSLIPNKGFGVNDKVFLKLKSKLDVQNLKLTNNTIVVKINSENATLTYTYDKTEYTQVFNIKVKATPAKETPKAAQFELALQPDLANIKKEVDFATTKGWATVRFYFDAENKNFVNNLDVKLATIKEGLDLTKLSKIETSSKGKRYLDVSYTENSLTLKFTYDSKEYVQEISLNKDTQPEKPNENANAFDIAISPDLEKIKSEVEIATSKGWPTTRFYFDETNKNFVTNDGEKIASIKEGLDLSKLSPIETSKSSGKKYLNVEYTSNSAILKFTYDNKSYKQEFILSGEAEQPKEPSQPAENEVGTADAAFAVLDWKLIKDDIEYAKSKNFKDVRVYFTDGKLINGRSNEVFRLKSGLDSTKFKWEIYHDKKKNIDRDFTVYLPFDDHIELKYTYEDKEYIQVFKFETVTNTSEKPKTEEPKQPETPKSETSTTDENSTTDSNVVDEEVSIEKAFFMTNLKNVKNDIKYAKKKNYKTVRVYFLDGDLVNGVTPPQKSFELKEGIDPSKFAWQTWFDKKTNTNKFFTEYNYYDTYIELKYTYDGVEYVQEFSLSPTTKPKQPEDELEFKYYRDVTKLLDLSEKLKAWDIQLVALKSQNESLKSAKNFAKDLPVSEKITAAITATEDLISKLTELRNAKIDETILSSLGDFIDPDWVEDVNQQLSAAKFKNIELWNVDKLDKNPVQKMMYLDNWMRKLLDMKANSSLGLKKDQLISTLVLEYNKVLTKIKNELEKLVAQATKEVVDARIQEDKSIQEPIILYSLTNYLWSYKLPTLVNEKTKLLQNMNNELSNLKQKADKTPEDEAKITALEKSVENLNSVLRNTKTIIGGNSSRIKNFFQNRNIGELTAEDVAEIKKIQYQVTNIYNALNQHRTVQPAVYKAAPDPAPKPVEPAPAPVDAEQPEVTPSDDPVASTFDPSDILLNKVDDVINEAIRAARGNSSNTIKFTLKEDSNTLVNEADAKAFDLKEEIDLSKLTTETENGKKVVSLTFDDNQLTYTYTYDNNQYTQNIAHTAPKVPTVPTEPEEETEEKSNFEKAKELAAHNQVFKVSGITLELFKKMYSAAKKRIDFNLRENVWKVGKTFELPGFGFTDVADPIMDTNKNSTEKEVRIAGYTDDDKTNAKQRSVRVVFETSEDNGKRTITLKYKLFDKINEIHSEEYTHTFSEDDVTQ